eukprot:2777581-Alexandrium_andersonii.AAC.1
MSCVDGSGRPPGSREELERAGWGAEELQSRSRCFGCCYDGPSESATSREELDRTRSWGPGWARRSWNRGIGSFLSGVALMAPAGRRRAGRSSEELGQGAE